MGEIRFEFGGYPNQTKLNVKLNLMAHCLIMICYEGCIVMSEVDLISCWIQRAELECSDRFIRQPKRAGLILIWCSSLAKHMVGSPFEN